MHKYTNISMEQKKEREEQKDGSAYKQSRKIFSINAVRTKWLSIWEKKNGTNSLYHTQKFLTDRIQI